MTRMIRRYVVAAVLVATVFASSICLGLVLGPQRGGGWSATWPEELEPYRKQAWTMGLSDRLPLLPTRRPPRQHQTVHWIPFDRQEDFEKAWPAILKVKDKGAPLILESRPFIHPWYRRLLPATEAGVLILCPASPDRSPAVPSAEKTGAPPISSEQSHSGQRLLKFTDCWGTIQHVYNGPLGKLPEYVVADDGRWVAFNGTSGRAVTFRARTDIVLVVDAKIVNLNRIRLPADTPIIDNRFKNKKKAPQGAPADAGKPRR